MSVTVPVPPHVLVYALRWALGDRSGRARDVGEMLIEHADALSLADRVFVIRETYQALDSGTAGRPSDASLWWDVVEVMGGRRSRTRGWNSPTKPP
jgi:hypothetical protein